MHYQTQHHDSLRTHTDNLSKSRMTGQAHTCQLTRQSADRRNRSIVAESLNGEKPALTAVHQAVELLALVVLGGDAALDLRQRALQRNATVSRGRRAKRGR